MSESFGQSHRQEVKDTNAGRVAQEASTAAKQTPGKVSVRAQRQDVTVQGVDDSKRVVDALIGVATELGKTHTEEWNRKEAIKGYNAAGTEKGRADVEKRSGSFHTKVFGPGASLRAAQKRIIKDDTDKAALDLYASLEKDGARMTDEEWQGTVASALEDKLKNHTDEGIKDEITQRFGENLTAIAAVRETKHDEYTQAISRKTFMSSATSQAEMAQHDINSGDPSRMQDANVRLSQLLEMPEGMKLEPWKDSVVTILENELDNHRTALWDVATENGLFDLLEPEQVNGLNIARGEYNAANATEQIKTRANLEYLAELGDIETVTAAAQALKASDPQAYEALDYATLLKKAVTKSLDLEQEAAVRSSNASAYSEGRLPSHLTVEEQQIAAEDSMENLANDIIRKQLFDAGLPQDTEITPQMRTRALIDSTAQWSRTWATNGIVTNRVSVLGRTIVNNVGRVDTTEDGANQIKNDLDKIMILQDQSPSLFAKHFTKEEGALLSKMHHQMSLDGQDPFEVLMRHKDQENRKELGLTGAVPTDPDRTAEKVGEVVEQFIGDKGNKSFFGIFDKDPENMKDLQSLAEQYYLEEFSHTGGDSEMAVGQAIHRLNAGSSVIGNTFVLGGAKLDTNSYGGSFGAYVDGINDDEAARDLLFTMYGIPTTTNLSKDAERYSVSSDGSSATMWIAVEEDGRSHLKPVVLQVPTKAAHIRQTDAQRAKEWLWKKLANPDGGGAQQQRAGYYGIHGGATSDKSIEDFDGGTEYQLGKHGSGKKVELRE